MSFSRLLLAAASSKKFIAGEGNDKVEISPKISIAGRDAYEGEVVLCFQLDDRRDSERRVARILGLQDDDPRCDGLIFYAQDGAREKVVCLVEMKSRNLGDADQQIIQTKAHIRNLLERECLALPQDSRRICENQINSIEWKACFYHHGSSPLAVQTILKI